MFDFEIDKQAINKSLDFLLAKDVGFYSAVSSLSVKGKYSSGHRVCKTSIIG